MWRYRVFFALLYFIQGATLAYIVNFQKPFLSGQGISTATLGLFTSSLLAPFILKVFLGMLSDRVPIGRFGSRKPYMAIGLGLFAVSYLALAFVAPAQQFPLFWALTWSASLGLALFDTCADGWAIDVADEEEQSYIQASMIAGKSVGLILMSLGFGWLAMSGGYALIFMILAALAMGVLVVVFFVPHSLSRPVEHPHQVQWSDLLKPFYIYFAVFAVVYSVASFGTDGLVTLHLSETRRATSVDIGSYGMARGIGALLGAWIYALLSHKVGLRRAQWLAIVLLGMGCLLPLMPVPLMLSGVVWGFCWGFQETAFVTLAMRFAEGAWAATFFAISMIFSNLGTSLGEAVGGQLVPRLGFDHVFLIFALLAWASAVFIPRMMRPI